MDPAVALSEARVAVIGDLMLDVYVHGEVTRISPEAPVPVVRWASETLSPGGAANVAANIAALGGRCELVGVAGVDQSMSDLHGLLEPYRAIDLGGVVKSPKRLTARKTRIIGHGQQIARIDRENHDDVNGVVEDELISRALSALARSDLVVLSDYGKGALTDRVISEIISAARAHGKKTIVDPKRTDLRVYRGADIITPNRAELTLATGQECVTDAGAAKAVALAQSECGSAILLTRSEHGMSFFPSGPEQPIHLPTVAREVFDVSGAGDTVVAALALSLAAGLQTEEAMRVANHAAGIVVGKAGTATVTAQELSASLGLLPPHHIDGQLLDLTQAANIRSRWRDEGLTVGVTNGCFDLIHPGHIRVLSEAAKACDRLIVALNSDASVRRLKGPQRPIQAEDARAAVVGAIKGVAMVVTFDQDTPLELIETLQPEVLVKGGDYVLQNIVGREAVEARGGRVVIVDLEQGHSTSRLVALAQDERVMERL